MAKKPTKPPAKATKKPVKKATKAAPKKATKPTPKEKKVAAKPGRKPAERVKFSATVSRETHQYLSQLTDPGTALDRMVSFAVKGSSKEKAVVGVDSAIVRQAADLLNAALA